MANKPIQLRKVQFITPILIAFKSHNGLTASNVCSLTLYDRHLVVSGKDLEVYVPLTNISCYEVIDG